VEQLTMGARADKGIDLLNTLLGARNWTSLINIPEFLTSMWRRKIAHIHYDLTREYPPGWVRIDYEERGLDYDWIKGLVDEDGRPTGKPDPHA